MNGWKDGTVDGCTNEWMDGLKHQNSYLKLKTLTTETASLPRICVTWHGGKYAEMHNTHNKETSRESCRQAQKA